jgi:uncharacterized protein YxjI
MINSTFFDSTNYFVDEKVNFLKFENSYQIFNNKGERIGDIKQKQSVGQKLLSLLLNKKTLPFYLEITDANEIKQASISRGWTFFMSTITIKDGDDHEIATIKQTFRFLKPLFKIIDNSGEQIAEISGDWNAWDFSIKNSADVEIGSISKKWAGALKEIFTSADKYMVEMTTLKLNKETKIAILSGALTIDMVLKENG